jgi:hypothetical protein
MAGNKSRGSASHNDISVIACGGTLQNAVFGYGNLIVLDGTRVISAPNALIWKLLPTHFWDAILETSTPGCLRDSNLSSTVMISRIATIRASLSNLPPHLTASLVLYVQKNTSDDLPASSSVGAKRNSDQECLPNTASNLSKWRSTSTIIIPPD